MDTGGGTGAPEQESDSEHCDTIGVELFVDRLPVQTQTITTPTHQYPLHTHTVRVRTAANTAITIEVSGYNHTPDTDFLLLVGLEIVRAARSRLRQGTTALNNLQLQQHQQQQQQ